MPCSPNDVSIPTPSGATGTPIPGFGIPVSLPIKNPLPYPTGFPEDLLSEFNSLQMLIGPGTLKPSLYPNFSKDIFDGILSMLDQFMPFLMLYKFFLPLLNIIICIIEVLCSLMNPFALISAIHKLFNQCIPQFLSLFPVFALILMIISLLILLLQLIEYLLAQLAKFVDALLRNINALVHAFNTANSTSVAAIAKKIGALLCMFQNLFVLLSIFAIIVELFQEILKAAFSIPPCEGGGPDSTEGCCAATYCPTIVQNDYTNTTGTLQYLPEAGYLTNIALGDTFLTSDLRQESWQLYDVDQTIAQAFWNIVDGYDISPTVNPKPVFFPTDANYSATTSPQQAAYTINLRLFYNPIAWGRDGIPQYIRFNNCIMLKAPTQDLLTYNNGDTFINNGVIFLVGGSGYLDDGTTILTGYAEDGVTPISAQATLENFLHMKGEFSTNPVLRPTDGYNFFDMTYTFTPNLPVLLQKNLVTVGCQPDILLSRTFVNNVIFSNITAQTAELSNLLNGTINGNSFPDPNAAQECLMTAVSNLRTNITTEGVAEFQSTVNTCLSKLQSDTQNALSSAIGIGFNPCESSFTLTPSTQFTTLSIIVSVSLNENNGLLMTSGLSNDTAQTIASNIQGFPTFGTLSPFTYDGYQFFTAQLTSEEPGSGTIQISYDNQVFCTNTLATNTGDTPTHTLQSMDYTFVYSPQFGGGTIGNNGGANRRDLGDRAQDDINGGS